MLYIVYKNSGKQSICCFNAEEDDYVFGMCVGIWVTHLTVYHLILGSEDCHVKWTIFPLLWLFVWFKSQ